MYLISFSCLLLLFAVDLSSSYRDDHGSSPGGGCFNQNLAKWRQGFEEWQHEFEKWKQNNDGCPTPTGQPPSTTTSSPFSTQSTSTATPTGSPPSTTISTPPITPPSTTTDICNGKKLAAEPGVTRYLISPNFPSNYGSRLYCRVDITAPPGLAIQIQFLNFSTAEQYDWLQLFGDRSFEAYSGRTIPPTFVSDSNRVVVIFSSDVFLEPPGFRLSFTSVEAPTTNITTTPATTPNITHDICNQVIFEVQPGATHFLSSTNFPLNYPINRRCRFGIFTDPEYVIQIQFLSFSVAGTGGLEIREVQRVLRYTGTAIPPRFQSQFNTLTLDYIAQPTSTGFKLSFTAIARPMTNSTMSPATMPGMDVTGSTHASPGTSAP